MAIDLYLTPQESCEKILHQVKSSNLHFILQESPFSVYLTVRKKFVGNAPKLREPKIGMATETRSVHHLEAKINDLEETMEEAEAKLTESESIAKLLETKVEHAEKK